MDIVHGNGQSFSLVWTYIGKAECANLKSPLQFNNPRVLE